MNRVSLTFALLTTSLVIACQKPLTPAVSQPTISGTPFHLDHFQDQCPNLTGTYSPFAANTGSGGGMMDPNQDKLEATLTSKFLDLKIGTTEYIVDGKNRTSADYMVPEGHWIRQLPYSRDRVHYRAVCYDQGVVVYVWDAKGPREQLLFLLEGDKVHLHTHNAQKDLYYRADNLGA